MNDKLVRQELKRTEKFLLYKSNWQQVELTGQWAKKFPDEAGVYVLFHESKPVYVGETGKISGRMRDLRNTMNHTVRRTIGENHFSNHAGYQKASSRTNFPKHIEKLVDKLICEFYVCAMPVKLGRKEIEEYISEKHSPRYNQRTRRN